MTIKFYLARPSSKVETRIFARICEHGTKFKYYTKESIKPTQWSAVKGSAKPVAETINRNLKAFASIAENAINTYKLNHQQAYPASEVLKTLLDTIYKGEKNIDLKSLTFEAFFEMYIADLEQGKRLTDKAKKLSSRRILEYKNVLRLMQAFRVLEKGRYKNAILFDHLDTKFTRDFIHYLQSVHKHNPNNIGKIIKAIKAVLNAAIKDNIGKPNTILQAKPPSNDVDNIALNKSHLQALAAAQLEGWQNEVRDLFLVGCYTGLRLSDLKQLSSELLETNIVQIVSQKTNKPVSIPVHPEVRRIYVKHGNCFPAIKSDQFFNKAIKEICSQVTALHESIKMRAYVNGENVVQSQALYTLVKSHTMRRTFATNAYRDGIPTKSIMAITGHSTESSFIKYLKLSSSEHAAIVAQHCSGERKPVSNLTIAK